MKKIIIILITLILSISIYAQNTPEKFNYQAVIRDVSGSLVTNQQVRIKTTILKGSDANTATIVYEEIHSPTTNANGLLTIKIGEGTTTSHSPSGTTIGNLNWGIGSYYIKTGIDFLNGNGYITGPTTPLLSVPYALHAKTADNAITYTAGYGISIGNDNTISSNVVDKDTHLSDDQVKTIISGVGYLTTEADGSTTNEIQTISRGTGDDENKITLDKNGGSFTDKDTHLSDDQVKTIISGVGYLTTEADGSTTNEIQTISRGTGDDENKITLDKNGGSFTDNDTHLSDDQVKTIISGVGYLTTEADGSTTNEIQTISRGTGDDENKITLDKNGGSFTDNDTHLSDDQVKTIISGVGYLTTEADGSTTNEIQTISRGTGDDENKITLDKNGGSFTDNDTHLSDDQVKTIISGVGYLTTEADGSTTNEIQTISRGTGDDENKITLDKNGGSFTDNDTHLSDDQVKTIISGVGYLTTEADGSTTNEIQTISRGTGDDENKITLDKNGGSFTDKDTHLSDDQVKTIISGVGYLTTEADGSTTNEIQTISRGTGDDENKITLDKNGGSFTDKDTHLSDDQVKTIISGVGYLTTEADGSTTNEIQTISRGTGDDENKITLDKNGGSFTDKDTHLSDDQVKTIISGVGYLTTEADGSTTNEIQTISRGTGDDENKITLDKNGGSFTDNDHIYTAGNGIAINDNGAVSINPTTYTIGDHPELGGYVFDVFDGGKHGWVVANNDQIGKSSFYDAQISCDDIANFDSIGANFHDWHLPTAKQLISLFNLNLTIMPHSNSEDFDLNIFYWSSQTYVQSDDYLIKMREVNFFKGTSGAWFMNNTSDGKIITNNNPVRYDIRARCVRSF